MEQGTRFINLKVAKGDPYVVKNVIYTPKPRIVFPKPDEFFYGQLCIEFRQPKETIWYRVYNPKAIEVTEAWIIQNMGLFDRKIVTRGYYAHWVKGMQLWGTLIKPATIANYFYELEKGTDNE